MKTIHILVLLFFFPLVIKSQNAPNLPPQPWEAIVDMMQRTPNAKWTEDIRVKLFGNYSVNDSLMVLDALKELDALTESISIKLSTSERGNLEIIFMDSGNAQTYESILTLKPEKNYAYIYHTSFNHLNDSVRSIRHMNAAINLVDVPLETKPYFITNCLSKFILPGFWMNKTALKTGEYKGEKGIFFGLHTPGYEGMYAKPSSFDQNLIRTVYTNNFETLLPHAQKTYKIRRSPHWIKKHAFTLALFPVTILLFLIASVVIFVYNKWLKKIPKPLFRFNVTSSIALLFLGFTLSLYPYIADWLENPDTYFTSWIEIRAGTLATLVIGLILVNIFRFIEGLVNRGTSHKQLKAFILFLSISLLPTVAISFLVWLAYDHIPQEDKDQAINIAIYISLTFTLAGVFRAIIHFFTLKEMEIKTANEIKLANLRTLKTKAELNALHSKINPHFLYNSLNSIAGLAGTDPHRTEQMALSLSTLFRYSINKEQDDWTTLADELEMVRIYLSIEKVRFDDRLHYLIEIPEELKSKRIPRFIIQPLVENAIKHGISNRTENGTVQLSVKLENNWLEISVYDNGDHFPKDLEPGFGLQSIYDKLDILYPNSFEIYFINQPHKNVCIKLATND